MQLRPCFKKFFVLWLLLAVAPLLSYAAGSYAAEIAVIKSMDILPYSEALEGFKEVVPASFREFSIEDSDARAAAASSLRRREPDLIFAIGTEALRLAKEELKGIPVVFAFVLTPEAVIGKNRPDITGVNMNIPPVEQFKALLRILPGAKRIGVIYDQAKTQKLINEGLEDIRSLGLTLITYGITTKPEAINAVAKMKGKVDALWLVPDTTVLTPEFLEHLLLFSFGNRVPIIGLSDKHVRNGALFALSFDYEDIGRQAGEIANRILKSGEIEGIPIRKPRRSKLSLNLNTAEKIGITVPKAVIKAADKLYK